ncbi:MAG: class III signal peptide-containing protein [Planctomycetota bacterium]
MLKLLRNKKGQGLVEYGILVGGVALIALASVSILGHKTTDLLGSVAAALPGAHAEDAAALVSGRLVATTTTVTDDGTGIVLDASSPGDLAATTGIAGFDGLVIHLED